jgi:hypothetical protein
VSPELISDGLAVTVIVFFPKKKDEMPFARSETARGTILIGRRIPTARRMIRITRIAILLPVLSFLFCVSFGLSIVRTLVLLINEK